MHITMKRFARILVGVPAALLVLVAPAYALTITSATQSGGAVTVSGSKAAKLATIS